MTVAEIMDKINAAQEQIDKIGPDPKDDEWPLLDILSDHIRMLKRMKVVM